MPAAITNRHGTSWPVRATTSGLSVAQGPEAVGRGLKRLSRNRQSPIATVTISSAEQMGPSSTPNPLVAALELAFQRSRATDAPLNVRLKVIADEVRALSDEFADAVDVFVGRLERAGAGETAPQVGQVMPSFILPDENGHFVSLEDLLARAPVAIAFHRGHWCPYCRLNAVALAEVQDLVAPVQIVAISAERQPFTQTIKSEAGAAFPVLTDFGNGYALSIDLAIWVDDKMASMTARPGWDSPPSHGITSWILPVSC